MFSMSQASRGTVKASRNFNASADAEVLYKAMKGLGKMLVCMLSAQCHLIHQRCVSQSAVQLRQTDESVLGGVPLWTITVVIPGVCMELHLDSSHKYMNRDETWVTLSKHICWTRLKAVIMCVKCRQESTRTEYAQCRVICVPFENRSKWTLAWLSNHGAFLP